jgi:hypothetical protein
MKPRDTFISPTGPAARFPEREMRVVSVHEDDDGTWIDAQPVRPRDDDQYAHCTFKLGDDGQVAPVYGGES